MEKANNSVSLKTIKKTENYKTYHFKIKLKLFQK